jgi:hypothetical protein
MASLSSRAAELRPEAVAAFNDYVRQAELRIQRELNSGPFLLIDGLNAAERTEKLQELNKGEVVVERVRDSAPRTPGALLHHWVGLTFVPGGRLPELLRLLQDYDRHQDIYQPEVLRSRLLSRRGDDFRIFLRLRKEKVITVILDTEYDVHYRWLDSQRAYSRSYSTRITEVEKAGTPEERQKPGDQQAGFMWRLNTYWRFAERDGGVYVQCEAISLSRSIPSGLGWLIGPFVTSIPRESLEFTLATTRRALLAQMQIRGARR